MLQFSETIAGGGRVPTREAVEQERSEQLEEIRHIRRLLHKSPQRPEESLAKQSAKRLARSRGL